MKKLKEKLKKEKLAHSRHIHNLKRKKSTYKASKHTPILQQHSFVKQQNITKKLPTPQTFSLIYNIDETLLFFDDFIKYSKEVDMIFIDMSKTESMTTEVLLYLISLDKINDHNDIKVNIKIKTPNDKSSRLLMAQSGFSNYFRANAPVDLNHKDIFTIRDGITNEKFKIDDGETCGDAVDFVMDRLGLTKRTQALRDMYNALSEMMLNTQHHAYDEDAQFRNWYLFGIKNSSGVAFYFFDNGKGIIKTARATLLEKLGKALNISLAQESIIDAVLDENKYRSMTNKKGRSKGMPQINEFFSHKDIKLPIIITNKIQYLAKTQESKKTASNFKGALFVWMFTKEEDE